MKKKHRGNAKCIRTGEHDWRRSWRKADTDFCARLGCGATRKLDLDTKVDET